MSTVFNETGYHVIGGFDAKFGYRSEMLLTDEEGSIFQFEEVVKDRFEHSSDFDFADFSCADTDFDCGAFGLSLGYAAKLITTGKYIRSRSEHTCP